MILGLKVLRNYWYIKVLLSEKCISSTLKSHVLLFSYSFHTLSRAEQPRNKSTQGCLLSWLFAKLGQKRPAHSEAKLPPLYSSRERRFCSKIRNDGSTKGGKKEGQVSSSRKTSTFMSCNICREEPKGPVRLFCYCKWKQRGQTLHVFILRQQCKELVRILEHTAAHSYAYTERDLMHIFLYYYIRNFPPHVRPKWPQV